MILKAAEFSHWVEELLRKLQTHRVAATVCYIGHRPDPECPIPLDLLRTDPLLNKYLELNGPAEKRHFAMLFADADLIVIGNNNGAGISRVEALSSEMRRKLIVTFTEPPTSGAKAPYWALGVTDDQFVQRIHLADHLFAFIAASVREAEAANEVPEVFTLAEASAVTAS